MTYQEIITRHNFKPWLGVLPGWGWLHQHEHDYDGWQPTIEMDIGKVHYNMTIRDPKVISEVCKVNRR